MQLIEERLRSLMLQGLAGDAAAYRMFLDELATHVRSYLQRRLRGLPHEVEDLLQELYADPHRHRRVARPATAALVARSPENHPTVTFCFVPTN
jgi:DNA-directed RNA polymerase specialized sigma24 family protein